MCIKGVVVGSALKSRPSRGFSPSFQSVASVTDSDSRGWEFGCRLPHSRPSRLVGICKGAAWRTEAVSVSVGCLRIGRQREEWESISQAFQWRGLGTRI